MSSRGVKWCWKSTIICKVPVLVEDFYPLIVGAPSDRLREPIVSNIALTPSDVIGRRERSWRGRFEGWPRARSRSWPSFETRARALPGRGCRRADYAMASSKRRPCASGCVAHQACNPTVFLEQECFEPGGIVRHDCIDHRWAFRERGAPRGDLRHGFEQAEVHETLECLEIAKHRGKHGIDKAEWRTGKIGTGHQHALQLFELVCETIALGGESFAVRGGFQHPYVGENRGAELHPGAVFGP